MFQFYKTDLKKIILVTLKFGLILVALKFATEYGDSIPAIRRGFKGEYSLVTIYHVAFYFLVILIGLALLRLLWKLFLLYSSKPTDNLFNCGINPQTVFPCKDEQDALLVKMSGLMSITTAGNGKNRKNPSFINSIEECNYTEKDARENVQMWLSASYDIENKEQLINSISSLLDASYFTEDSNTFYQDELTHLYQLADETSVQLNRTYESNNMHAAFNLQRAAMLTRWGFTLDWITPEEWNAIKKTIAQGMEQFESLDKFVHDYMLSVYMFHNDPGSNSSFMIVERLYGLAELQKHHYFELSAEQLNQLKPQ